MPVLMVSLDPIVLEEKPVVTLFTCVKWRLELNLGYLDMETKEGLWSDERPNVKDGVANFKLFHLLVPLKSFYFIIIKVAPASEFDLVGDFYLLSANNSTIKMLVCNVTDLRYKGKFVTLNELLLYC